MSHESDFETDLRDMMGRGQVIAVLGSGVSLATTSRAPSWRGLIDAGVGRCRTIGVPDDWCQYVRGQLQLASHPDMLLSAAELVHQKLCEQGGELARWLRESFAELQPEDPTVIQLLVKLNVPLVTTNYDDLIEKTTQLKHVCWTDAASVSRFVRGDERRVLHLHGHWQEPDSVVLGIRSYEAVKNNEHTQAVIGVLRKTLAADHRNQKRHS